MAKFRLLEAVLSSFRPDTIEGLESLAVLYSAKLWAQWPESNDAPDLETARAAIATVEAPNGLAVLDVEHWPINQDPPAQTAEIAKYYILLSEVKLARPDLDIGYYGRIPIRDYWAPTLGGEREVQWRDRNAALLPLAELCDAFFPSLYTFYPDQDGWVNYAIKNLEMAPDLDKPSYPFLWPQYHGSSSRPFEYIGDDYWRLQLETCLAHADGLVVWGVGWDFVNGGRMPWSSDQPWYRVLRKFIADNGLDEDGEDEEN